MNKLFKLKINKSSEYWAFMLLFFLSFSCLYFFSFRLDDPFRTEFLNIIEYLGAILIAMVAGYFAYSQFLEIRFEKIKEQANLSFKRDMYARAINLYTEAISIRSDEFPVFAEYTEVLIAISDFDKFDLIAKDLKKYAVDKREHLICCYLMFSRFMLQENLGFAKKHILETIESYEKNKNIFVLGNWDFSDIKRTENYKSLQGEAKKIFDNYIKFVTGQLKNDSLSKFLNGDYILS